MKLPQLVQQLWFRLVDGQPFPLDVYRSGGDIFLPGQQHSRLILIEAEENRPRLEFLSRRRVGVVGHVLEKVAVIVKKINVLCLSSLSNRRLQKLYYYSQADWMLCYLREFPPHAVNSRRMWMTLRVRACAIGPRGCQSADL